MTNEQAVIKAGLEIARLKDNYMKVLSPIVLKYNSQNNIFPDLSEYLKVQKAANEYFNYTERFVGDSGLLGAHANGKWVTGFAEDCAEILNSYILHAEFIRSWSPVFNVELKLSDNAFSNMQRMVVEYLPVEQVKILKERFEANALPIQGFNVKAMTDDNKHPKWQLITSIVIGVITLFASVVLSILYPEPTQYQEFILRGLFAISLASLASLTPGFINLNARLRGGGSYFMIYAGGAIAIFVLIWLVNPPKINQSEVHNESDVLIMESSR
ncbi:hypothetical protein ACSZNX_15135 [Aeromonas veronii]|uniref:hypothetical protein n=1 Tax=Aeromonas veronii TaxID=654 RepID=UPI00111BAA4D|nr:hypothetical protein [Aeromonas veronii]TNI12410.1 hypothetical protein CF106_10545 [Aeromonas veronii]